MSDMPRPQVSENLKKHLEQVVEKRADVPAKHLTFEQKVIFVFRIDATKEGISRIRQRRVLFLTDVDTLSSGVLTVPEREYR